MYDPWADAVHVRREYGIEVTNALPGGSFDAVILAVAHKEFQELDIAGLLEDRHVVFDVKGTLDRNMVDGRL